MNQLIPKLIPKYSFIKLFLPHAKNYNQNLYHNIDIGFTSYYDIIKIKNMQISANINIDIGFTSYSDIFKIKKMEIGTSIDINNNFKLKHNITTSTTFVYDNKLIKENIDIKYDKLSYHIQYKLNDESINIPKFKIENDNHILLLEYYKFMSNDFHKYYIELDK